MSIINISDDISVNTHNIISVTFKKGSRYFVTKDKYERYKDYIKENQVFESEYITGGFNTVKDIMSSEIGEEKSINMILITSKGDHVDVLYKVNDSDNLVIEDGKYIELIEETRRPELGKSLVEYSIKVNKTKVFSLYDEVLETIVNNVI